MRIGGVCSVALSLMLGCMGDTSSTDDAPTSTATAGGAGAGQPAPPASWPDGEVPFDGSVTLVHKGELVDWSNVIAFTTGPAGHGDPVDLSFVLTNHGDALSFSGEWVTGDGFSLVGTPPAQLTSGESLSLTVRFDPKPLTVATQADGLLSVPAEGVDVSLELHANVPRPLRAIIYGRGDYTAVSNDYGATWTDVVVPTEITTAFQTITWGGGRFFRSWSDGTSYFSPGRYAWSDDGLTWHASTVSDAFWAAECDWGLGRFVCARNRHITWSQDGSTAFHETGGQLPFWNAMVFAGDRFVAVGRKTGRAISMDGATWTNVQQTSVDERLYDVAFGGGMILAVGGRDRLFASVSSDGGMNWTHTHWNPQQYYALGSVVWFGGRFLITGSGNQNCLFESTDGQQFDPVPFPHGNCPELLGMVGGRLIAVQDWGGATTQRAIWSTTDAITWTEVHTMPAGHVAYDLATEEAP